jgi:hypothetical protein
LQSYPNRHFLLVADLDFTGNQISTLPKFHGVFDGGGRTLTNWAAVDHGPIFDELGEGAIVKNLSLRNFMVGAGQGILANFMRGAVVHHLQIINSSLIGGIGLGLIAGRVEPPFGNSSYHGFIDHVILENVALTATEPWAWGGLVIGSLSHTPFRISNVQVNSAVLDGENSLGAILGGDIQTLDQDSGANLGNLWMDSIAVEKGVQVNGSAFASGIIGFALEGDTLSNSYSKAEVISDNIGGAGFIGTIQKDPTKTSPTIIANAYFAGSLAGEGILVGSQYYGGQSIAIQTVSLDSLAQPFDNSGNMISNTNFRVSYDALKDPNHHAFSVWRHNFTPPWFFVEGQVPALVYP